MMHAYIHTHTHAYTHAYLHPHIHAHAHTHTHTHTHMYAYIRTYTHTRIHTHSHTHPSILTCNHDRQGQLVAAIRMGESYTSMNDMLTEMLQKDKNAIRKLIDTRGCVAYSDCTAGCGRGKCACEKCAFLHAAAADDSRSASIPALNKIHALKFKLLFPLATIDVLHNLAFEMVCHGVVTHSRIIPKPEDTLSMLYKFMEYRVADP
jgi:hypothetical protein